MQKTKVHEEENRRIDSNYFQSQTYMDRKCTREPTFADAYSSIFVIEGIGLLLYGPHETMSTLTPPQLRGDGHVPSTRRKFQFQLLFAVLVKYS